MLFLPFLVKFGMMELFQTIQGQLFVGVEVPFNTNNTSEGFRPLLKQMFDKVLKY